MQSSVTTLPHSPHDFFLLPPSRFPVFCTLYVVRISKTSRKQRTHSTTFRRVSTETFGGHLSGSHKKRVKGSNPINSDHLLTAHRLFISHSPSSELDSLPGFSFLSSPCPLRITITSQRYYNPAISCRRVVFHAWSGSRTLYDTMGAE